MVLFNYSTKELTAKVVYYGPGLCGKTTNLQWIHEKLPIKNKGKMLSLATETDRTLFFDFLPIELGTIRGMKTRIQLYTVPGQVFYNATRRMVLKGADCVVFVATARSRCSTPNLESLENLRENLEANEIDPDEIPMVLQYNKRDLPNALPLEILNERLNPRGLPFFEAVAMKGIGRRGDAEGRDHAGLPVAGRQVRRRRQAAGPRPAPASPRRRRCRRRRRRPAPPRGRRRSRAARAAPGARSRRPRPRRPAAAPAVPSRRRPTAARPPPAPPVGASGLRRAPTTSSLLGVDELDVSSRSRRRPGRRRRARGAAGDPRPAASPPRPACGRTTLVSGPDESAEIRRRSPRPRADGRAWKSSRRTRTSRSSPSMRAALAVQARSFPRPAAPRGTRSAAPPAPRPRRPAAAPAARDRPGPAAPSRAPAPDRARRPRVERPASARSPSRPARST